MREKLQYIETTEKESEREVADLVPDRESGRTCFSSAVTVGRLCIVIPGAGPFVDFPGNQSGEMVLARTAIRVDDAHAGCEVALAFEEGDATRPVILGILQSAITAGTQTDETARPFSTSENGKEPERLLITAGREITLRCGKASITLTEAGKLLLRGAYLLSRSSGVNRIKGGSVQIN